MESRPDLIVGVDFGTTFTGVAWVRSNRPRAPIQVIKDWPHSLDGDERKVPSQIRYNSAGRVSTWGFSCEHDRDSSLRPPIELFKLFVDRKTLENFRALAEGIPAPSSHAEALSIATDYLRSLREHVRESISSQLGLGDREWRSMKVQTVFSVPTTWTALEIMNDYKRCIHDAGFDDPSCPDHSFIVDLTEAEAAATTVLKYSTIGFRKDDYFLCVDAGGGTTDLALGRVTSDDPDCPQFEQVAGVRGVGIGSTLIDRAFRDLVNRRVLSAPPADAARLPPDCALRLARSQAFKVVKHNFGKRAWTPPYRIRIEELSGDVDIPTLQIESGSMLFSENEMKSMFDPHIVKITWKIREQLDWLQKHGYNHTVKYIILSGGLGKSDYVRLRLRRELEEAPHHRAVGAAVLLCEDPQLAVVKGLLINRQQDLEASGKPVLASRVSRASYGIVVKEAYDPVRHLGELVVKDPYDHKKEWAMNQIEWLVKKGARVNPNAPVKHRLKMAIADKDDNRTWKFELVQYHGGGDIGDELPTSKKHGGVVKLCDITSDLTGLAQSEMVMMRGRRKFFSRGKKYWMCTFDVVVVVAPADLKFELQVDGKKFSRNHDPITVRWDEAGAAMRSE